MKDLIFETKKIKGALKNDEVELALDHLEQELQKIHSSPLFKSDLFKNETVLLFANLKRLENAFRLRTISWDQMSTEKNRIIVSILNVVQELEEKNIQHLDKIKESQLDFVRFITIEHLTEMFEKERNFLRFDSITNLIEVIEQNAA